MLRSLDAAKLASDYLRIHGIDIRKYLGGIEIVRLYRCDRTGYRFYYPFNISGDSEFYSQLEKYDWYYMATKWEHDEALKYIRSRDAVLEIGAARGDFLRRAMRIEKTTCVGLELNQNAVAMARTRGVNVLVETAEEHATSHLEEYDVVCLFQVLEHISNPASVIGSATQMLKPGGRLIIAVPDNSTRARPSIFVTEDNVLNMPPHHQGLWDLISLTSLTSIYPISIDALVVEPAEARNHRHGYRGLIKNRLREQYGVLGFVYYLAIRSILTNTISDLAGYLPAHSVLASYTKRA